MNSSNSTNDFSDYKTKEGQSFFGKFWGRFKREKRASDRKTDLDKKLVYSLSGSRIPNFSQLKYVSKFFSKRELAVFRLSWIVLFLSMAFLGIRFYNNHLVAIPSGGGTYSEALVGSIKHINPLYSSVNDVDSDLTALVFSSLFKRGPRGELHKDLVTDYSISSDNKTYTFKIQQGVKWHNGSPLTIDDIIFTLSAIQDGDYKSSLMNSLNGVLVEKADENSFKMTLPDPYSPFLDLLTFGIIPQDLWLQVDPQAAELTELNLKPVGSGPYRYDSYTKDKNGNIKTYTLEMNPDYYGPRPYIEKIVFKVFPTFEEAIDSVNKNSVDGLAYLPEEYNKDLLSPKSLNIYELNLPQLNAVFFNAKNNAALSDKKVRQALASAVNKNHLISDILGGGVRIADGPLMPDSFAANHSVRSYKYSSEESAKFFKEAGWQIEEINSEKLSAAQSDSDSEDEKIRNKAETILAVGAGKWLKKKDSFLIIKFTFVDNADNHKIADSIQKDWEKMGIKAVLDPQPANDMQSNIIKPRNFEALLYGQVLGADPDVYAFWHSSQAGENGLNITDFSHKEVDTLLEDARTASSTEIRKTKYYRFQEIIAEEVPAIFLFSPTYTYVQSKLVKGFAVKDIILPRDRFSNLSNWYVKTKKAMTW